MWTLRTYHDAPVALQLRPVAIADFRLGADLQTRARPQEPVDPPSLKHRFEHPGVEGPHHLHLVLAGATPGGVVSFRHPEGAASDAGAVTTLDLALVPEAAPEALQLLEALALVDRPQQLRGGPWTASGTFTRPSRRPRTSTYGARSRRTSTW